MKICFLQVTPFEPNTDHIKACQNSSGMCDFYFVTHDKINTKALSFCPKTTWAQTRNILVQLVPKQYDYYCFVDYDYDLVSRTKLDFITQLISDLTKMNPAVLIPYPGKGLTTELAKNLNYLKNNEFTHRLFTHCGMKCVHHSLLNWFFPMIETFDGGWSSSHYFNILEIPFYNNIVLSHNILYNHTHSGGTSDDNSLNNMHNMWNWLKTGIRYNQIFDVNGNFKIILKSNDCMKIKKHMILFSGTLKKPKPSTTLNYFDLNHVGQFFYLKHENFKRLQ